MSQKRLPNWHQLFLKNGIYHYVQIPPIWGPNTYQIMYGATLDFQREHKMPDRKINLCSKFAIKNLLYRCKFWHCKSKVSPYINTYLDHMVAKFEPNRMLWNVQNFDIFNKRPLKKKTFLTSVDATLQDISVAKTIVFGIPLIFRLPFAVSKLW